ncbi:MAG: iron chelate uptake ABC transporter family permease subunit, partial [Gemmatimonadales bacterium]
MSHGRRPVASYLWQGRERSDQEYPEVAGVLNGCQHLPADSLEPSRHPVAWGWLRGFRLASAFLAGAALAVGGVVVQGLFRNPLASPSVLGTTAGAS